MALGDFWDVPAEGSDGSPPTVDVDPAEEHVGAPSKVRLALAKVLPVGDGRHRGASRGGPDRLERNESDSPAVPTPTPLDIGELDDLDGLLRRRNDVLAAAIKRTQDLYIVTDQRQIFRLAATDLFVEKVHSTLGVRARTMWRSGIVATASAIALLVALSAFLVWRADSVASTSISGTLLTLVLVEMLGTALIVFVGVKYLFGLSRSFFHENVTLVARQHALGFGRLYVYSNPDAVRLKDLQDAFGLDLDNTPIFLDIKAKETADTIYSKVTQDLGLSPGRQSFS
jgi:hypothetical protein